MDTLKARWKLASAAAIAVLLLGWIAVGPAGTAVQQDQSCTIGTSTNAGATSNESVSLSLLPQTAWQPRGGKVQFTLESKTIKLQDIKIAVCFGWKTKGDAAEASVRSPQVDVVSSSDAKTTFAAVVPDLPSIPYRWPNRLWTENSFHFFSSGLVPVAVMRVYASGAALTSPLDAMREVGITSVWSARGMAAFAALFAFGLISLSARARGVPGHGRPVLGIISTRAGYASLSQFQLITWSFVVGVGAAYVLTLSGGLIDVPDQMLVLLGITGVTTLGARVPDGTVKSDTPKLAEPTTDDVGGVAVVTPSLDSLGVRWNAARSRKYDVQYSADNGATWTLFAPSVVHEWCRITNLQPDREYMIQVRATGIAGGGNGSWSSAVSGRTLAVLREPRWSDLVVADNTHEIDVTRVQMLFFTLIAASFVAIRLFNSYEIPAVPDGFLWLMGLSNGIYLSAKFVP